ncbi:MAG: FAD-dependent oxidoreductase [Candidatus Ranarchaeia archaeon]
MQREIIILGCGAAGSTAALQARKFDRKANIHIITMEDRVEYSRCGLPHGISGIIPDFKDLQHFPDSWYEDVIKTNLYLKTSCTKIDTSSKQVTLVNEYKGEIDLKYDSLVIATGGNPAKTSIEGLDSVDFHHLRTIDDAIAIKEKAKKSKFAIVIGGGLIALELGESLKILGTKVAMIVRSRVLRSMVDEDISGIIQKKGEEKGIEFYTSTGIKWISARNETEGIYRVELVNRETGEIKTIKPDLVVVCVGVKPSVDLAKKAGIKIGELNGILTNEKMETNIPNVYAAGDCIESVEFTSKKRILSGMGTLAVRQGLVAGINAAGGNRKMPDAMVTRVTKLFDLEIAGVGLTKDQAEESLDEKIIATTGKGFSLPKYYPGGKEIYMKLLFKRENGTIIGAQMVGEEQVAQRINILAGVIQNHNTVEQLSNLETCYAPPISPTWDIITTTAIAAMRRVRNK